MTQNAPAMLHGLFVREANWNRFQSLLEGTSLCYLSRFDIIPERTEGTLKAFSRTTRSIVPNLKIRGTK